MKQKIFQYANKEKYCILVQRQFKHIQHIHNKAQCFVFFFVLAKEAVMKLLNIGLKLDNHLVHSSCSPFKNTQSEMDTLHCWTLQYIFQIYKNTEKQDFLHSDTEH